LFLPEKSLQGLLCQNTSIETGGVRVPAWQKVGWGCARALLTVAGPVQRLVDRPSATHLHLNRQALQILYGDGLARQADFLARHLPYLQRGVSWADTGWKNVAHYFDPRTGCGLKPWPGAAAECERYFARAMACWRRGRLKGSLFFLGAAAHLVQDLCVPYHAGLVPFSGHQAFERWAEKHLSRYPALTGMYGRARDPAGWVAANARDSLGWLPGLVASPRDEVFDRVAAAMVPLAMGTTAGFLVFFLERAGW